MDAIVIAGGIPAPGEPLYPYTQGKPKALLDICGKPMGQWVLDALNEAQLVDHIILIGLDESSGLQCSKITTFLPSAGSILQNIRAGVEAARAINPAARHVLIASSDVPAVTPASINWIVETTMQSDDDVYYNVITRPVMEARFPDSRRSYTRLKDMEVCGGDVNVVRTITVTGNDELFERIIASRKNVFRQAALIGYGTLFLLLLRQLTLEEAVKRVVKRVHLKGRAIVCPYAEVGMDIDKPHQLELICKDLSIRVKS